MSRLEEIKKRFKAMNDLPSFKKLAPTELFFKDIDYLIRQGERVEELEELKAHYGKQIQELTRHNRINRNRSDRFGRTLEFYADEDKWICDKDADDSKAEHYFSAVELDEGNKARQALKWEL